MEFVCFCMISEETVNLALQNIKKLFLVSEMESVYCAVRTQALFLKFSIPKCYHIQLKHYTSVVNIFYLYTIVYICQSDMFRPSRSPSGPPRTQI